MKKEIEVDSINTKENKKRRNYIILIILFVISICFVLYVREIYKVNDAEKKKTPIIDGMIYEIYKDDLAHYILENPTTIIYMCTADGEECRTFERDFKKYLKKNEYNEKLVYLNLTDLDQKHFVDSFNEEYKYKLKLTTDYPAFVLFEDGKVKSILQGKDNKKLTITKVEQFLELNEIEE